MFEVRKYRPNIDICLDSGAYVFDMYAATGKTYLCNLAEKYRHFGVPIAGYTYNDHLDMVPIRSRLDSNKFKVAILDRYDMYYWNYIEEMKEFVNGGGILLVDTKTGRLPVIKSKICYISFNEFCIHVFGSHCEALKIDEDFAKRYEARERIREEIDAEQRRIDYARSLGIELDCFDKDLAEEGTEKHRFQLLVLEYIAKDEKVPDDLVEKLI